MITITGITKEGSRHLFGWVEIAIIAIMEVIIADNVTNRIDYITS